MKLKYIQESKNKQIVIRLTEEELEIIREKANLYAEGNISMWVRYAASKLKPKGEDLNFDDTRNTYR